MDIASKNSEFNFDQEGACAQFTENIINQMNYMQMEDQNKFIETIIQTIAKNRESKIIALRKEADEIDATLQNLVVIQG